MSAHSTLRKSRLEAEQTGDAQEFANLEAKVLGEQGTDGLENKDQIKKDPEFEAIELELETNQVSIMMKMILDQQVSYFRCDRLNVRTKNRR